MAVWLKKCIPFLSLCLLTILAETSSLDQCKESSCGIHGPTIRFPFRLKGRQPEWCGYNSWFDLYCTDSNDTVLELPFSAKALVKSINYTSQLISVSYPEACLHKHIASFDISASPFRFNDEFKLDLYALFNCSAGMSHGNTDESYIITTGNFSCLNVPGFKVIAASSTSQIIFAPLLSCTRIQSLVLLPNSLFNKNIDAGLNWFQPDCKNCERKGGQCKVKENKSKHGFECNSPKAGSSKGKVLAGEILGPFLLILVGVTAYCFYVAGMERKHYIRIKKFLKDYKALKPARYSYADIKRITNQFKEELGQGAYGTVFKGKLSNEIQVAVKVLNTSTGNGQEFINEMEAMCQIHHVNVARLVGFCADGLGRALVYEFLPNGSLQKFISSADNKDVFLGWEMLQNIALGIAKGVEYLHQGCDKRILHFDIKPHNVLLDNNFTPKISDFGLAKLCSKDQSIVSMTAARGTLGYIAPEVFSRNFGNVSYKSDVYSYGMLLLEMVGGRKITDVTSENSSHVNYPQWIYNLLENNEDIKIHIEEEDTRVAKKLSVVGLWCIQWHPINRPTMKAVVQMLEGDGENLEMPPNPFASTSATRTSARFGTLRLNQELDVISEIE
ncbi:rust resistance kinase Lr10-like [Gastrolobium bilobum]|uniref:rust resistance kinase Lr10-like n=1 Tax=Gastrolobium bilobum TaxID=150636 RepID=UPI002AB16A06|nr:rust resistance kinase Lr10-like [Gastrolobium bilobum]